MRKISYSQFSTWSKCPHQWKLKYVDKQRPFESTIDTVFGTSIHEAIQEWLKLRTLEWTIDTDVVIQTFKTRFIANFKKESQIDPITTKPIFVCDQLTFESYYKNGVDILTSTLNQKDIYFPPTYELVGIEIELTTQFTDHLAFTGFIDIVLFNPELDEYIIIDLKTSNKGWGYYQKKDTIKLNQILLYKKHYSDQFGVPLKNIRVEFIILTRNPTSDDRLERFIPSHNKKAVEYADAQFRYFLDTTFAQDGTVKIGNLPPTPSKSSCKFCPFVSMTDLCTVGIAS